MAEREKSQDKDDGIVLDLKDPPNFDDDEPEVNKCLSPRAYKSVGASGH
jgi:hypothetical protein